MRKKLMLGLSAVSVLALAACGPSEKAEKPSQPGGPPSGATGAVSFEKARKPEGDLKIKLITNGISPFWDAMGKGLEVMKAELKVDATWQAPQQADNNAQKRVFEDAVAAGADGIGVSPIQADAFAPVIDSAIAQGIPVITFDSDSEKSKRLLYIGTNNYEAGRAAGEEAKKLFPNGGNLVAFVGNMSAQNARDRYRGFLDAIKGTKITMLQDPYEDDKDAVGRARRNVGAAIVRYGDKLNGLVGLYSYNGPAIVDEVMKQNLRSKLKIICFDGEPKTLKNLEAGLVDVTVVQKPFEFGRIAVKALYLINRKGLKAAIEEITPELTSMGMKVNGNVIDTGVQVVTPANAAEFLKSLKDKGLEST
jgi:ribose transport system substrate-binding protein